MENKNAKIKDAKPVDPFDLNSKNTIEDEVMQIIASIKINNKTLIKIINRCLIFCIIRIRFSWQSDQVYHEDYDNWDYRQF